MIADRNHSNTSFITSFISYNTCYFHHRQIFSSFLMSPTWLPTKQHQPSAFTDQQLIWLLSQNYPKRDKNRRKGDYTLLYIGILRENGGDYIIEYQQLKSFIVQVVAFSLCKLWLFHYASWGFLIKNGVSFLKMKHH